MLKVLKSQAEKPVGNGGNKPFPKGTFKFGIQEVREKAPPEFFFSGDNPRMTGPGGEILVLWLGDAVPLPVDGQPMPESPGAKKLFHEIAVRDGHTNIMDFDPENANGEGWLIQKDARLLANLAIALGAVTEADGYVIPSANLVDLLRAGTFNGHEVIAQVAHGKPFKKADGTTGQDAFIEGFTGV